MRQAMAAMSALLVAACGGNGKEGSTAAGTPPAGQAEGIAESVSDVAAARRAAATPLPAPDEAQAKAE